MSVSALNHARADWQAQFQSAWIIQAVQTIGYISMPVAHGCQFFGCAKGFQMLLESVDYLVNRPGTEPFLLGVPPLIRLAWPTGLRRRSQILADVEKVAQES